VINTYLFIQPPCQKGMHYNASVENSTIRYLLDLNREFYQTFALQFSTTRKRLQPGVKKIFDLLLTVDRILDLGCGNGELALALKINGFGGIYVGIDSSDELLKIARHRIASHHDLSTSSYHFACEDLSTNDWQRNLPFSNYRMAVAFAVLHHMPGQQTRRNLLKTLHGLLPKYQGGQNSPLFIHSEWQFLNSRRLKARLVPWEVVGLSDQDIEEGDYLLDWKQGGYGLRYVHHFSEDELGRLAQETGFRVEKTFYSDGENGKLSVYQYWETI
jgi:tRNA (uracil-5-)-methyltransferase TRM9